MLADWICARKLGAMRLCAVLLLSTVLLLSFEEQADATCRGHLCDEQHEHAKQHGLLGSTLRATGKGPKQCDSGKSYPKDGRLKPQGLPTPIVNIRWAGKDADVDKVPDAWLLR